MECRTFRVRLAQADGDEEELNEFLGSVEVAGTEASLVDFPEPVWSVLVFFEGGRSASGSAKTGRSEGRRKKAAPRRKEPAGEVTLEEGGEAVPLKPREMRLLERLKEWRAEQAVAQKVPPYCVANNASLESIATTRPASREDLARVKGFGPSRIDRYADEILSIVAA